MPSSSDVGQIFIFMIIVFALASWFAVAVQRYYEQYGMKVFFWVFLLYGGATAGVIYAFSILSTHDAMNPLWLILCAGVGLIYTGVGSSIVSKPMPMLPVALHPLHVSVRLGVTHGIVIEARGRKANPDFITSDVRLHVEGDQFWTTMGTIVSSSLISMAQMTLLPLQLVPLYLPDNSFVAGSPDFNITVSIGSKMNGQKGLGFKTIHDNLAKLVAAGDPPLFLRFQTPPNQPLFQLELKASLLQTCFAAGADPNRNIWVLPPPAAGVDVKVPDPAPALAQARADVKLPESPASPAAPAPSAPSRPGTAPSNNSIGTSDLSVTASTPGRPLLPPPPAFDAISLPPLMPVASPSTSLASHNAQPPAAAGGPAMTQ